MSITWETILRTRLNDPVRGQALAASIAISPDVGHAIQHYIAEEASKLSDDQIQQLLLIFDVEAVSKNNTPLALHVLADESVGDSMSDVARLYYTVPNSATNPASDEGLLQSFRAELFARYPTAVLSGLVDSGLISAPSPEAPTQSDLSAFLKSAVTEDWDIKTKSVEVYCSETVSGRAATGPLIIFVAKIQRLQALVEDARDIQALLGLGFTSARDIARNTNSRAQIASQLHNNKAKANRIYNNASRIVRRNEQAWIDFLALRTNIPLLPLATSSADLTDGDVPVTYASLFGGMDNAESDPDTSLLSPAAYLVDLLEMLRTSSADGAIVSSKSVNLLQKLKERRPDIELADLSKANTINTVQYANLVVEILEYYIDHKCHDKPTTTVVNDTDLATVDSGMSSMVNTIWSMYKDVISAPVSTLAYFPFNLSTYVLQQYMSAIDLPMHAIVPVVHPTAVFLERELTSTNTPGTNLLQTAIDRRSAADYMSLSHEDFIAITSQAFHSPELVRAMRGYASITSPSSYADLIGLRSTAEYWGYTAEPGHATSALDKFLGKNKEVKGIAFIQASLLPRAQITFNDLLTVLQTQFMGGRLLILGQKIINGKAVYSDDISDLQLIAPDMFPNPQPENQFELCCFQLQALLRLWKRSGWDLSDLDASIVTVETSRRTAGLANGQLTITPEVIEGLAAIKQLSLATDIAITALLPLWSDMLAGSPNLLYDSVFCLPHLLWPYPGLRIGPDGASTEGKLVGDLLIPMMGALSVTESDLSILLDVAQVKENAAWDLEVVSRIYRYNLLVKMLNVSTSHLELWFKAFPGSHAIFADPRSTLQILLRWQAASQSVNSESSVLLHSISMEKRNASLSEQSDTMAASTLQALQQASYAWADLESPDVEEAKFSEDVLASLLCLAIDKTAASDVVDLVSGTKTSAVPLETSPTWTAPSGLPQKMSIRGNTMFVNGLIRPEEADDLVSLVPGDQKWKVAINASVQFSKSILGPLLTIVKDEQVRKVLWEQLSDGAAEGQADAAIAESTVAEKRRIVVQSMLPYLRSLKGDSAATKIFEAGATDLDVTSRLMVKNCMVFTSDSYQISIEDLFSTRILAVNESYWLDSRGHLGGVFISPVTGTFYLHCTDTGCKLVLNELTMDMSGNQNVQLESGRIYRIELLGCKNVSAISFLSSEKNTTTVLTTDMLISEELLVAFNQALHIMRALAIVIASQNLSGNDLEVLVHSGLDISRPSLGNMELARAYTEIRGLRSPKASKTIRDVLCMSSGTLGTATVSRVLADYTGWRETDIEQACTIIFGTAKGRGSNPLSLSVQDVTRISQIIKASKTIGVTPSTMAHWFELRLPRDTAVGYEAVKSLQGLLQAKPTARLIAASDKLGQLKKDALVSFLLTMEPFSLPTMGDKDSFFGYFLMDVSMGPQQKTSRIRQAISTIQTYVQRCLLGMEKANGVATTAIDQKLWSWMSKYTLWQANRKVFLYPENWADPTLRDDKSPAFKAVETMMAQGNLNIDMINDMVRQYVYQTNDIADLQIQTYLWEKRRGFEGSVHFFARTRTAPYHYYHRILVFRGSDLVSAKMDWMPWVKMDIEVLPHEVDWDGTRLSEPGSYMVPSVYRGRLFLFMPQILLKTTPVEAPAQTFEEFAKSKRISAAGSEKSWEIRISWVERQNNVWSKKQTTTAAVDIVASKDKDGRPILPSISTFRFQVVPRAPGDLGNTTTTSSPGNEILGINVSRWIEGSNQSVLLMPLAVFELRGTQLVLASKVMNPVTTDKTLPTSFCKFSYSTTETDITQIESNVRKTYFGDASGKPENPLLALCPAIATDTGGKNQELTWTLSYNSLALPFISALIIERKTLSRVETFFARPDFEVDGTLTKRSSYLTQRLMNVVSQPLMEQATMSNDLDGVFQTLERVPQSLRSTAFGGVGLNGFNELASPYSIYNWELGFHLVSLLVERLQSTGQYELALQIAHLVFDPKANDRAALESEGLFIEPPSSGTAVAQSNDSKSDDRTLLFRPENCWKFRPLKAKALRSSGSVKSMLRSLSPLNKDTNIEYWKENPFDAHAVARARPAVYMKRFIMKYIEVIVALGDESFRRPSLEAVPMALQRYIEASHLFGAAPQTTPPFTKPFIKAYADIVGSPDKPGWDSFSNARVDLELLFPFWTGNKDPSALDDGNESPPPPSLGVVTSRYFSLPPNPQLAALRDLIDDRLFKIRNGLDINGQVRNLPLFDPPLDPGQLVKAAASGMLTSAFASSADGPMPNYRFVYMLQKAFEICAELRVQSDALLPIREKRDAEKLSCLRAKQDLVVQSLIMDMKTTQKEEALKSVEVLEDVRKGHVMRLKYFTSLSGDEKAIPGPEDPWEDIEQSISHVTNDELAMTPYEKVEMDKTTIVSKLGAASSAIESASAILMALPNLIGNVEPLGCGASMKFDAGNVADGMMIAAGVIKAEAQAESEAGSSAARKGQLIAQRQDRRMQANMAGRDIKNADKQIESARARVSVCERDIAAHKQQMSDLAEAEEFMRTKYTNQNLYEYLETSLRKVFFSTYEIALDIARSAEKSLAFERGGGAQEAALAASYWDDARDGSMCAQNLYLGLKRLETAYQKRSAHDFEISKDFSLRQIDPWALLKLQTEGSTVFSLDELLLDMDFPGHYCRRIKSVSVSIPSIVGPYTGVCCTVKLLKHGYRLRKGTGNYYPSRTETDDRYWTDRIPITSIAISGAQHDRGRFQAEYNGERYGPFEGAGVMSTWSVTLPAVRQFDYSSISDVVLHVEYTALDGGVGWTTTAQEAVTQVLKKKRESGVLSSTVIDISRSPLWQWNAGGGASTMILSKIKSRLPFWTKTNGLNAGITQAWLVVQDDLKVQGNDVVTFNDVKATESSKTIDQWKIWEIPASNYAWEDMAISMKGVKGDQLTTCRAYVVLGFI